MLRDLTKRRKCATTLPEYCYCEPLASRPGTGEDGEMLRLPHDLDHSLRAALAEHMVQQQSLSLLVLHVFQHESAHGTTRRRIHASATLLDQVLANVRRVIRHDDILLIHANTGAALLFPGVDQPGIAHILERVYDSLDLLQGQTLQPPLTREMVIQLGIATYPTPASSLEQLLIQAGQIARSLELQPALTRQLNGVRPVPVAFQPPWTRQHSTRRNIPFMELPKTLPGHLTTLLPYELACELHCAPVGRHQQTLTVALLNPSNTEHVQRLQAATGLTIFPVSCDEQVLNHLLAQRW